MSNRKSNSFSIRLHTVEFIQLPIPVERRERRRIASFNMPPSVEKKIRAYAKRINMSASEFITILCVNFLEATDSRNKGSEVATGQVREPDK
jgi:hypothetical protein